MYSCQENLLPCSSLVDFVVCNYPGCNKLFRSRFSCKRHQLVHTRDKRFACKECGRKFSFAQHLREHSYRHTNVRPYKCGISDCLATFRHSSELSLHRRTHPEYRLKKYHYVEESKASKKRGKRLKGKNEKTSKAETIDANPESSISVSYTHLTLPTICSV
eukprot:TRINITY_DN2051_c0_g1_i23.p1 TRINITY_DN2051_c0_g1~~TRINITY_DN2051_c0_g1_i23.p1  ORF type:complete len:161 (-),score=16.63 TRINITY_DN2051_c0_g1_i23:47-529(-)